MFNSIETNVPCYNCEKRSLGCHGTCEEYKVFKQKCKADSDKKREYDTKKRQVDDFIYMSKGKLNKGPSYKAKYLGEHTKRR